jgi:hypothetical protein
VLADGLIFLTPLGALLALGALVPLAALVLARRRASRVRRGVGLPRARGRSLLVPLAAIAALAALLGLAAAQPVLERTSIRKVRTDAEVFFVVDVSRSMLASERQGAETRIDRVRATASELRGRLSSARVGVASMTDRLLPHLFPSANAEAFQATLDRTIGIERPPPRGSFATNATDLNSLTAVRGLRFFSPTAEKRLVVVFTDGESIPVASARLGVLYRRPPTIETIFLHFWDEDERVFTRGAAEPQYRADPSSRAVLDRLAASTRGYVYPEESVDAAARAARKLLGEGPTIDEGQRRGREALAPYFAFAAFVPLSLLLWRRDR